MQTTSIADQLINHVNFEIDGSGSTFHLTDAIDQKVKEQASFLARKSSEVDQETRITLATFDTVRTVHYYDIDALRLDQKLKNRKKIHSAGGSTALISSTMKAIRDLQRAATLYGDHAFLVYVWTDGEENASNAEDKKDFRTLLSSLGVNWTLGVLVPDDKAKRQAINYGFPENNIALWNAQTVEGLEAAQNVVLAATENYFVSRSMGVRGTTNLFQLDLSNVTKEQVQQNLISLPLSKFKIYQVENIEEIAPFVRARVGLYKKGMAFYQLTLSEEVQAKKQVILRDKQTHEYFTGPGARQLVGLPDYAVTLKPREHPKWDVFVESWSHNRKTDPGTDLLVFPQS